MSVYHRIDNVDAMDAPRLFGFAWRLADHPGSVSRVVTQAAREQPRLGTEPTEAPQSTPDTGGLPQVSSLDEVRALRARLRARRYPAEKWGETRYVDVSELAKGVTG